MRPNWKIPEISKSGLVKNVHYSKDLENSVESLIDSSVILSYEDTFPAYESVCAHYNQNIENCFMSHGATDVIDRIFRFLDFDNVYIVEPTFEMVRVYSNIYGKTILESPINPPENSLLYYANPNGLSGQLDHESHDGFKFIIIDEVYSDFCPAYSLIDKRMPNEIIIKSLSKSLGLPGLRVGFCFASTDIINNLQNTRTNHVLNSFACHLVPKLMKHIPDVISSMNETKEIWYNTYNCIETYTNFVIFKEENELTKMFPCRKVEGGYRLSLMDKYSYETLVGRIT